MKYQIILQTFLLIIFLVVTVSAMLILAQPSTYSITLPWAPAKAILIPRTYGIILLVIAILFGIMLVKKERRKA